MEDYDDANDGFLFVMEDGETILPYDSCCSYPSTMYDPKYFEFIGKGVVVSLDGVLQDFSLDNPDHVWYFYKRIW